MTKKELVAQISEETGVTLTDTRMMIDAIAGALAEEMVRGGRITLPHLGTFYTSVVNGTRLVDVNGNTIVDGESTVVRFKACKELRARVRRD